MICYCDRPRCLQLFRTVLWQTSMWAVFIGTISLVKVAPMGIVHGEVCGLSSVTITLFLEKHIALMSLFQCVALHKWNYRSESRYQKGWTNETKPALEVWCPEGWLWKYVLRRLIFKGKPITRWLTGGLPAYFAHLVCDITHLHSLKFFRSATYGLEVNSLVSDQPGAADVICNAQEMKMRLERSERSGLMNPHRGAAVGMDY